MRKPEARYFEEYASIIGRLWRETLAVEAKIPFELLDRSIKGKRRLTDLEMDSLCKAMDKELDALFPLIEDKKKKSA